MRAPRVLILTHADAGDAVREAIHDGLDMAGAEAVRIDDLQATGAVLATQITDAIQGADVVVADVTQESPNLFYELGYAHALRKPTVLLLDTENARDLPSNLAGYQMVFYDRGDPGSLSKRIYRHVRSQTERIKTAF
ncbi:MAG: hypothetical protein R3247_09185 [Rhodothermales bacterium]|nr:hypothetical protein [Rhodothermales bacterium]